MRCYKDSAPCDNGFSVMPSLRTPENRRPAREQSHHGLVLVQNRRKRWTPAAPSSQQLTRAQSA